MFAIIPAHLEEQRLNTYKVVSTLMWCFKSSNLLSPYIQPKFLNPMILQANVSDHMTNMLNGAGAHSTRSATITYGFSGTLMYALAGCGDPETRYLQVEEAKGLGVYGSELPRP